MLRMSFGVRPRRSRGLTSREVRRALDLPVSCECNDDEREALEMMRSAAAVQSDANLIRLALWNYAKHLGVVLPADLFALRTRTRKRLTPKESPLPKDPNMGAQAIPLPRHHPWSHPRKGLT